MLDKIGDLIDKLTIINIKIWDATYKVHNYKNKKKVNEYLKKIEYMNAQRHDYIQEINHITSPKTRNLLHDKSIK